MRMRFTVVDHYGTISFSGPGHGLKMLAAACSSGVTTHRELLFGLDTLDASLATCIRNELSSFDEHCLPDDPESVAIWLQRRGSLTDATFRVLEEITRHASLQPERLGLVIFNLPGKRIVQVQNSYGPLHRSDRGRIRSESLPTRQYYRYELPSEWALVP
jgi:hypothetical protein